MKSGTDIRGRALAEDGKAVVLTPEIAQKIGYQFALHLARKARTTPDKLTIAVGRDSRVTGVSLAAAVIEGLTAADCDVYDCGLSTTPAMVMTTIHPATAADGAVMVTGSHMGPAMNGFKLVSREGLLTGDDVSEILAALPGLSIPRRLVTKIDFLEQYRQSLADMVRTRLQNVQCPLLGLHVVVDAGNGAGGFYADFLEELGAEITGSQFLEPDGRFPHHNPSPENARAIEALAKAVVDNEADLGVMFDSDCDRAAIVDADGRIIHRNRLIALIAAILLDEEPNATFVTDSVTSIGLTTFINEWGGVHYRFRRGYRNVIDEAIRLNEEGIDCPLAMETTGHAALRENHFIDDGMYLVTRILIEALKRKREGLTLSSLIEELREPIESVEIRVPILSADGREAGLGCIDQVLAHTLVDPGWHLAKDNREGVRILFDLDDGFENAWLLLRLSVHEPVMAVHAESDVAGGVARMLAQLYALVGRTEALDFEPLTRAIGSAE